jgi:hypothetical protein
VIVLALLTFSASPAPRRPSAKISRSGMVMITLPAQLIRSSEVQHQLTSGLTTVFVVSVAARDQKLTVQGGTRIDVRLDLWEEKYLVSLTTPSGEVQKLSFASDEALATWWSENALVVTASHRFVTPVEVEVKLRMLPFSSQEQSDTQRWLSRTLSADRGANGEPTPAQSAEILRIIVETSVRRRPLLEYEWSVRADAEGR